MRNIKHTRPTQQSAYMAKVGKLVIIELRSSTLLETKSHLPASNAFVVVDHGRKETWVHAQNVTLRWYKPPLGEKVDIGENI